MDAKVREQLKQKLEAANPGEKLYFIRSKEDGIEIFVKGASAPIWAKYQAMIGDLGDGGKRSQAHEFLVMGCLVHPTRDELAADVEAKKKPGFYSSAAVHCRQFSGQRESLDVGEL